MHKDGERREAAFNASCGWYSDAPHSRRSIGAEQAKVSVSVMSTDS